MPGKNKQIKVAAYPKGMPTEADFSLVESDIPQPGDGQVLIKTLYISVDPYMRGLLTPRKSYIDNVHPGDVMVGGNVGVILESKYPALEPGKSTPWQKARTFALSILALPPSRRRWVCWACPA